MFCFLGSQRRLIHEEPTITCINGCIGLVVNNSKKLLIEHLTKLTAQIQSYTYRPKGSILILRGSADRVT
ncbi:unnamed protein product [Rhizophagus irregularis]|nr:unnamed protein product [Rhizophagus irregularis]